jgi:hypothetical protein
MSAAPRDARVPSESTADFADFIKSTGPAGESRPIQRNVSNPYTLGKSSLDSRRVSSASNRNRYTPREAVTQSRNGSSDLIDFIRQGPPGANSNRIPQNIAPWDTTGAPEPSGGKAVDASIPDIRYSQASTHGTESSMPSIHSSINSNTALLKNKGQSAPTNKMFDDDDMMPKRKTRRVKDPYAIDFSDEDEEDDEVLLATPKPPIKKEESLAEFLMNCEPPPEPVSVPISEKMPKKKASAPSLMGRFTRKESQSNTAPASPKANDTRSLSSRAGLRNYIPIQVNIPSGYDKYGMPIGENQSRPAPVSSASSGRRVPMKKFEPRDATSNVSRTSDLAAFLRSSEPPPEPIAAPSPPVKEESGSSLSKMFSRRRK